MRSFKLSRDVCGAHCVFAALVMLLVVTRPASAQWRNVDAQNAWAGYQNVYLHLESDGYSRVFVTMQGGTTPEDFWRFAEEIEVAEDAYNENKTTANKNMVQSLLDGFVYLHGDDWSSDLYNDDLDVATIAMARGYLITGTTRWKTDAQANYSTVWSRAQAGDGGLCQVSTAAHGTCPSGGGYENGSANLTFVWAAMILNSIAPSGTGYKSQGDGVYAWAKAHLINSTSGGIGDAKDYPPSNWTYLYGYALIDAGYEADSTTVTHVADYVFNDLTNYNGTYQGYNVMPNYGQGNNNNGGFNGILMRGVGFANALGYLPSADLAAAQANLNLAWSHREGAHQLVWNDWQANTPSSGNYSWDDSAALAGLLDLPPTA